MTFCARVKTELTEQAQRAACCQTALLYGMLLFSKTFSLQRIVLASEHHFVTDFACELLREFGIAENRLVCAQTAREKSVRITDGETLERIFYDFGYSGDEPNLRVKDENFLCDSCAAAFAAGCFLTGGNVTDPEKGYHLEFSSSKSYLVADLAALLTGAGFEPRVTSRGYAKVLYFKNSGQIEDMLTLMGAVSASLELMDAKIYKEIVNSVNRRTNCENANIDKIVESSARDCEDIALIQKQKGWEHLESSLRELARLRLEYPEVSMQELGGMMAVPLGKSGVSHRLRRIRLEAQKLREQEHEH